VEDIDSYELVDLEDGPEGLLVVFVEVLGRAVGFRGDAILTSEEVNEMSCGNQLDGLNLNLAGEEEMLLCVSFD
jgi:hypothetical protein